MSSSAHRGFIVRGLMVTGLSLLVLSGTTTEGHVTGFTKAVMMNGLPTTQPMTAERERAEVQSMLMKYAARCALREDQELEGPADANGKRPRFHGSLGLAPEWHDGTCNMACQEKVSSCLIALVNRTGKHVQLSLLSAAVATSAGLTPNDNDIGFPHQEGAFFGNVFSGEAYACRGHDVQKGAQVKRFCALEPESCTGVSEFVDAGRCDDVCEMKCSRLGDGSQRCAAVACKDPTGRRWPFPITTYLRNQIEAGNADKLNGTRVSEDGGVEPLAKLGAARFEKVDFGGATTGVKTFVARVTSKRSGGRIEVWLDGRRRLAVLDVENTGGVERDATVAINGEGISGMHTVVLKMTDASKIGRLSSIEFR
jgi:hypothetical protein